MEYGFLSGIFLSPLQCRTVETVRGCVSLKKQKSQGKAVKLSANSNVYVQMCILLCMYVKCFVLLGQIFKIALCSKVLVITGLGLFYSFLLFSFLINRQSKSFLRLVIQPIVGKSSFGKLVQLTIQVYHRHLSKNS